MNHKAYVQLETHTVEDTQRFGQLLGRWVKQSGEPLCIALIGDLGTGKTHLSQGIAKGFGVTEEITSPTFAIISFFMKWNSFFLYNNGYFTSRCNFI